MEEEEEQHACLETGLHTGGTIIENRFLWWYMLLETDLHF